MSKVTTEKVGHVLKVGLNRPDKMNAADEEMLHQLALAYGQLENEKELRVGLVFAHGDHFTAGLDLFDVGPKMQTGKLQLVPEGGVDPWGIQYIKDELQKLVDKGRLSTDDRNRFIGNLSGALDYAAFAVCDWVIEAVFEELKIKQEVFAKLEAIVSPECILATNTSSLSVDAMAANLKHPQRLVGFHFFNPVAVMPLVEVVRANMSSDEAVATAMEVAKNLKNTAVITSDSAGFVVNRLLGYLLGEAMRAVDEGASFEEVANAIAPLGLPMNPFDLLELVGLKVGAHVLDSMHAFNSDRFYASANLHKLAEHGKLLERDGKGKIKGFDKHAIAIVAGGTKPRSAAEIFEGVQVGLAREIKLMLDERVVGTAQDIDLCMIMGAGWPFHLGGITPYLDRCGASQKAFGGSFHNPMIIGVRD